MISVNSKGGNKQHRTSLNRAICNVNLHNHKVDTDKPPNTNLFIIVGTKNIIPTVFKLILSKQRFIFYFTGFGRLFTDFGRVGRLFFRLLIWLSDQLDAIQAFIVENEDDKVFIEHYTKKPLHLTNGSGFDPSLFTPNIKIRDDNIIVIGHMCRFGSSKCTDQVLKFAKTLRANETLIIAGADISGDQYTRQFRALSRDQENIKMLGYLKNSTEVSQFFNSIDIFIYPSLREGLPISLLESIYHGVPFVTTNVPGCRQLSTAFGMKSFAPEKFSDSLTSDMLREIKNTKQDSWEDHLSPYLDIQVQKKFEEILRHY